MEKQKHSMRIWKIFLVTLIIALPIRLYQTLFLLEEETGFYRDGDLTTGAVFIALMAGCLLIFIEGRKNPPPVPAMPVKSLGAAVAGMFTGFLFCGQALFSLLGTPAVDNAVMNQLLAASEILAGLALLAAAYGHAVGQNLWRRHPLPALLPALWGCVCLVVLFITYAAAVNIAENVYDTFAVVFLLLFFFAYAKLHAGIEPEKAACGALRYGLMAILFGAVTVVPELAQRLAGMNPVTAYPFGMYLMNGAASLFVLLFLLGLRRTPAAPAAGPEPPARGEETPPEQPDETEGFAQRLHQAYGEEETFLPREEPAPRENNSENQEQNEDNPLVK